MKNKYLFKVHTKSFHIFVVADSFDKAKQMVESYLNQEDYGWTKDREVINIEKVASTKVYPNDDNFEKLLINEEETK